MSLIIINSPLDYQSIKKGASIQYEINCENPIPLKSSFSIWIEYSETPDFKNLSLLEVSNVSKCGEDGSWSPVDNNFIGIPGKIRFNAKLPSGDNGIYTRVVLSNPDERVCSRFITLSRCMELDFCLANPIITDYSTSKVKVTLDYDAVNPENLDIRVLVSNNAMDGVNITWEDMTEAYNHDTFYTIQNSRINQDYAVNVRVIVTKKNVNSSIKIKKINIAHF